jgi:imidazolonepropionase-like amidohydrolase
MEKIARLARTIIIALAFSGNAHPADKPLDRSQYFDASTQTSDDLRRVPVPKGYGEPKGSIVIRNARLFDGTGATARSADILIEGSHIRRIVSPGQEFSSPSDAQVIDVAGRTVMPGMIDLHTHLTYVEQFLLPPETSDESQADAALRGADRLRYFVESGITSVRDVASHGLAPFILKKWVADGRIPGPRIFAAGQLIVGTGGHGADGYLFRTAPSYPDSLILEVTGADAWRQAVRLQFKRGADLIKLASHFAPDEVKAAVDEAHALGLRVTVDSETIFTKMAVEAGVDCIEHPLPRSDDTIRLMAKKGVCADVTLVPYQYINAAGGYVGSTSRRFTETNDTIMAMARKLKDAGVTIGIGTDLVTSWYKSLPEPYIQELRNYVALGNSPAQALMAATKTNAEILGMSDRLGTIVTGKLADLVVVSGRPDQNLEDLHHVGYVIVNGRVIVQDGRVFIPRHIEERAPYSTAPP